MDVQLALNLDNDEVILWQGQPDEKCYLQSQQREQRLIIVWLLVILSVISLSSFVMQSTIDFVYSVVFLFIICASTVFFAILNKRFKPPNWYYAITNKRILYQYPDPENGSIVLRQLTFEQIKTTYLKPKKSCISTLVFVPTFLAPNTGIQFICVDQAREVQDMVSSLIAQKNENSGCKH